MRILTLWFLLLTLSGALLGSDHADPTYQLTQDSAITDLFAFPDESGERLVVILAVRRALEVGDDFDVAPYRFQIHFDLNAEIDFKNPAANLRYGGRFLNAESISSEASLSLRVSNDGTLRELNLNGSLGDQVVTLHTSPLERYALDELKSGINARSSVFDDPFIFPSFFGSNVIATVISIPLSAFPEGQKIFAIWADSFCGRRQIDHAGRALRTQLPRFDHLNTLAPGDHVASIRGYHDAPGLIDDVFQNVFSPLFAPKSFDEAPDVMILNLDRPVLYPNGRNLEDDVAKLCASAGDALFYDLSFVPPRFAALATSPGDPVQPSETALNQLKLSYQAKASEFVTPLRPTTNDKPFRAGFPYLADPWTSREVKNLALPERPESILMPALTKRSWVLIAIVSGFILLLLILIFLSGFKLGRYRRAERKAAFDAILKD